MVEIDSFSKPFVPELTAARIGINRNDWYSQKPGMTQSEIKVKMITSNFDMVFKSKNYFTKIMAKNYFQLNSISILSDIYFKVINLKRSMVL